MEETVPDDEELQGSDQRMSLQKRGQEDQVSVHFVKFLHLFCLTNIIYFCIGNQNELGEQFDDGVKNDE